MDNPPEKTIARRPKAFDEAFGKRLKRRKPAPATANTTATSPAGSPVTNSPEKSPFRFNSRQRAALLVATWLVAAIGLFPPWTLAIDDPGFDAQRPYRYALIFQPPPHIKWAEGHRKQTEYPLTSVVIDTQRLYTQWLTVFMATFLLMLYSKDPQTP